MAYNVVIAADFGAANTGLTVHGELFGTNGSQVGSTITSGFVEAVSGLYVYVLPAPDSQEGVFVTYDSANTALRRVAVIAPRETENSDVKASTLSTALATVDTVVDAIKVVTDNLPDSGALTTLLANVASILAATGIDGVAIASATMTGIADAVLGRSVANVEDAASIYSIAGLILAQFESSAPGTTWTIKKTDGTTTFATRTLTEDINAKPVTGVS